ncbi:MAG: NAD-dependent epimerase/dehydratase family protein [Candidatus Nanopelagicales bacterium]
MRHAGRYHRGLRNDRVSAEPLPSPANGHQVVAFVRRDSQSPDEIPWRPGSPLDPALLHGLDGIVHLAGAGIGDKRWTDAYKQQILGSRVDGTTTIATAMAHATEGPRVLVNGSAIGYYGDTGDRITDETGPKGEGFLADVVQQWEAATAPARDAGLRVAFARTGLVVSGDGGAWQKLLPIFKAGVGGKLGSGKQYWSPISLNDEVRALRHLLEHDIHGPVNLVGPDADPQRRGHEGHGRGAAAADCAAGSSVRTQGCARGVRARTRWPVSGSYPASSSGPASAGSSPMSPR